MELDQTIQLAISSKQMLDFSYRWRRRVVQPHVLGIHAGVKQLVAYQIGGESTSGILPEWRRFDLAGISDLKVLDQTFVPRPSAERTIFDSVIAFASKAQEHASRDL